MKQFRMPDQDLLVLEKGEELIDELTRYAQQHKLTSAWMEIIGGASAVTLGYYNPSARQYQWRDFSEPLEIVGLRGNLAIVDGAPVWHIHGAFGRVDSSLIGGHVKSCTIGLTGEVILSPFALDITRHYDNETGLNLLDRPLSN